MALENHKTVLPESPISIHYNPSEDGREQMIINGKPTGIFTKTRHLVNYITGSDWENRKGNVVYENMPAFDVVDALIRDNGIIYFPFSKENPLSSREQKGDGNEKSI